MSEYLNFLKTLETLEYCINCQDVRTGKFGCFAYDAYLQDLGVGYWSISPIFTEVDELYRWTKEQGFCYHSINKMFSVQRKYPN